MFDYSMLAILFLIIAIALVVAEILIPSGGMITVMAIISMAVSIWCAWKAWWTSNPLFWWVYLGSIVVLLPAAIGGAFYLLPRTRIGQRVLLEAPRPEEVQGYAHEVAHLQAMVGKQGKTLTMLNPGGLVSIDGERLHSQSEGMIVDAGEDVVVIDVRGNRLLVRQTAPDERPLPPSAFEEEAVDNSPLDFDVSQG